ncbi:hypothetical protein NA57DRAFT_41647 [Rhizodiscina lignyota]|uniref:EDC4-like protein pdc1 beta-propeller domain-containing protein n=1 Tax=Rhizodiscina lignyota TaxID=1504668 RepID=A0A9P4M4N7_9PEZI|nr:hypothetical protein NA57DRAFT_41647 [Rhizodiscina lignyota]
MADLQELLARLNQSASSALPPNPATTANYQHPSVSSPIVTPSPSGPQPHHDSAIMSPNVPSTSQTPLPEQNNRSANLLNLLKFSQPSSNSPRPTSALSQSMQAGTEMSSATPHDSAISASDLVASFMRKPSSSSLHSPTVASPVSTKPGEVSASAGGSSQAYLLNLLNQGKPSQPSRASSLRSLHAEESISAVESAVPEAAVDDVTQDLQDASLEETHSSPQVERKPSPFHVLGHEGPGQFEVSDPQQGPAKPAVFTYVNPFEQLSASSPRNHTPVFQPHPATGPPKVEILKHEEDNKEEELTVAPQTVSEAVGGVGEVVDKQVEQVLAQVEDESQALEDAKAAEEVMALREAVRDGAAEIKQDLKDDQTRREIERVIGKPTTEALEEVTNEIAGASGGDSWESADAEETANQGEDVRVYNFPMKPFTSLEIKDLPMSSTFKQDAFLALARVKKEFDQNDRALVAASERYIAYVTPKHGGFRVLSQENGSYKNLFAETHERIVNLALCSAVKPDVDSDTVLATGVNGSVFWTHLSSAKGEQFSDNLDERSFIFPPFPVHDDNTSGGQLKTRARRSSRHPQFFAIGRGKSIHIVWPFVARSSRYTDPATHVCDSGKYLRERNLKIATGKAGKDFTFSQCDTVIASLDKTGKMRFWDVRELVNTSKGEHGELAPIEIKTPIQTLATTSPADKSWPTSIMFLDKERPYNKGIACRYLIVGMKQNHTLQLWDLCLEKAVQEINLPHENESDGICSVTYHPQSGIISVGHPTRNSIYFIHLSAPRYLLPPMSQAKFLTRVAEKDKNLPKIESTAIMTGIREFSFAPFGQLRSFESLDNPSSISGDAGDNVLFELYVMHSKGVCRLSVKTEDMGWGDDNNVLNPIDAEKAGVVVVSELKAIKVEPSDASVNGDNPPRSTTSRSTTRESSVQKKEIPTPKPHRPADTVVATTLARVESKQDAARAAIINGTEKTEKKDKKKAKKASDTVSQVSSAPTTAVNFAPPPPSSYAKAVAQPVIETPPRMPPTTVEPKIPPPATPTPAGPSESKASGPVEPTGVNATSIKQLEDNLTAALASLFNQELAAMYQKFDEDKRIQDAAGAAKQDAILRLVSSTLTENVEKSLSRIVGSSLSMTLLPALSDHVGAVLERKLQEVPQEVSNAIGQHHNGAVSSAIQNISKDTEFQRGLGEFVVKRVASHIDSHLSAAITKSITPAFTKMTVNAVQQIASDMEQRMSIMLQQADAQRQHDSGKIDQLTNLVRGLSETVHSMAATQSEFQNEILRLQRQVATVGPAQEAQEAASRSISGSTSQVVQVQAKSDEEVEMDEMRALLRQGQIEAAVSSWVQSPRQVQLFEAVLCRYNPVYVRNLPGLVAMSAAAAVTQPWEPNMHQRLAWLDNILISLDPTEADIRELTPRIMDIISQRLKSLYMQIANTNSTDPVLPHIYQLDRRTGELKERAQQRE